MMETPELQRSVASVSLRLARSRAVFASMPSRSSRQRSIRLGRVTAGLARSRP
jgi:hypothetical protein